MLGRVCIGIGHKLRNTLVIAESEDFYDVDWAKYCVRCGDIILPENLDFEIRKTAMEWVSGRLSKLTGGA